MYLFIFHVSVQHSVCVISMDMPHEAVISRICHSCVRVWLHVVWGCMWFFLFNLPKSDKSSIWGNLWMFLYLYFIFIFTRCRYQTMQSIHTKKAKQISSEIKLCVIKWNGTGEKYWTREESEVQNGIESQSVIRKQSCPLILEINISWFSPNTYSSRMIKQGETRVDISARQWSQTQPMKLSIGFRIKH